MTALLTVASVTVGDTVFPRVDEPARVDAIVVLGPSSSTRLELARTLVDEGYSKTVLVSTSDPRSDAPFVREACAPIEGATVTCLRPDPYTTEGEARLIESAAEAHGWSSVVVITSRPHITRARLIIERCFSGQVLLLSADEPRDMPEWLRQTTYQSGAMLKAVLNPGCQ